MAKSKEETLTEMLKKGVHFGHKKSNWNPAMEPYIFGVRGGIHIINLDQTYDKLEEALDYLGKSAGGEKNILFVGTALPLKDVIRNTAEECGMPYVTERWIGGTLTNFKSIKDRLQYFRDLEERKQKGELEKYPKVEQREFDRELERLEERWGGIKELTSLPDIVFVVDYKKDNLAVNEALHKDIPVVAICDTNADPSDIDYPIPANDDAVESVHYILNQVKEAILEGKKKKKAAKEKRSEK